MLRKGISLDQAVSRRILNAGFDAIAEYDQSAVLVGTAGALSSGLMWGRVATLAISGQQYAAADTAASIALDDLFAAVLGVEGGGLLLAIVERTIIGEAADDLAAALDRTVTDGVGPKWAPALVGAGAVAVALIAYLISKGAGGGSASLGGPRLG